MTLKQCQRPVEVLCWSCIIFSVWLTLSAVVSSTRSRLYFSMALLFISYLVNCVCLQLDMFHKLHIFFPRVVVTLKRTGVFVLVLESRDPL